MMRALLIGTLVIWPAVLSAQVPMGGMGGMGGMGRGMGRSPNDPTMSTPMKPERPRVPKADEMVDLGPLLRGVTLTDAQKTQLAAITDKYHPLILPALDVIRQEVEAGDNGDLQKIQRYTQRANRYREQEVADIKLLLDPQQLVRFDKNVLEFRNRNGSLIGRP